MSTSKTARAAVAAIHLCVMLSVFAVGVALLVLTQTVQLPRLLARQLSRVD